MMTYEISTAALNSLAEQLPPDAQIFMLNLLRFREDGGRQAYSPAFDRIDRPALFLHAEWDDVTCNIVHTRLAEPMRADCTRLSEVTIAAGRQLMLEDSGAAKARGWRL